jgi:peptidoglycan L-alanyl-D-glutamate endopeptidase CwlK
LATCHVDLQVLFNEVIKVIDCTIVEGHRGKEDQEKDFAEGKSKAHFGQSKHNISPSMAVDVMKYYKDPPHLHWEDLNDMELFAKFVLGVAEQLKVNGLMTYRVRWGGDWNMNGIRVDRDPDEHFIDGPHFELVK